MQVTITAEGFDRITKDLAQISKLLDDIITVIGANAQPGFSPIHDVPYHSQWESGAARFKSDCGPACVMMLLDYCGVGVMPTIDQLSVEAGMDTHPNYTSIPDLVRIAGLHQLALHEKRGVTADRLDTPCIALIHYASILDRLDQGYTRGHWVVVTKVEKDSVTFHDPDYFGDRLPEGKDRRVSLSIFQQALNDCALDDNPVGLVLFL